MEHTKGPWELISLSSKLDDWTGASLVIRNEYAPGGIAVTIGGVGDEEEANARLIAAAPDLLEAVKDALIYLDHEATGLRPAKLVAAIVKAEG